MVDGQWPKVSPNDEIIINVSDGIIRITYTTRTYSRRRRGRRRGRRCRWWTILYKRGTCVSRVRNRW